MRLSTKNAAKLFALVQRQGLGNARVVVLPDPNAPIMAKRERACASTEQARKAAPAAACNGAGSTDAGYQRTGGLRGLHHRAGAGPMAMRRCSQWQRRRSSRRSRFLLLLLPQWQDIPHGFN